MIKHFHIIFALILVLSCARIETEAPIIYSSNITDLNTGNNFVSDNLVRNYLAAKAQTKTSAETYTLDAYTDSDQDTLMYIVNYGTNAGWQVLSSDIRTPAILAYSNTGRFSLEDGSEGFRLWMATMAQDMKAVRNSRDDELTFTEEEIEANKTFWGQPLRKPFPPEEDIPTGQWYTCTYSYTEVVDSIPHLTVTQWDQNKPYNSNCPTRTDTTSRAAAGCVAISGAQMLYYLHSIYGAPVTMYTDAEHIGNVDDHHFFCSNQSSSIWADMTILSQPASVSSVPESSLIAYIGQCVAMEYGNDGSGAYNSDLVTNVFNAHGYSCSYGSYNETFVKNSLLNNMPLVVGACSQNDRGEKSGHSFIIDGYLRTRIHTETLHYYRTTDGLCVPGYQDYITHSYTTPEITAIKMNWGWWRQWASVPVNDGWFTLTGGWTVQVDGDNYTYQYYRDIIHNFSLSRYQ